MRIRKDSLQIAIDMIKRDEDTLLKAYRKECNKRKSVKRKGEEIHSKAELEDMLACDLITYDQYLKWCERLDRVNTTVIEKTRVYTEAINVLRNIRISLLYDLREEKDGYIDMSLPDYKDLNDD